MNDISNDKAASAKRGKNRDSLFLMATLRFPKTGDERDVRIRNLSEGGLMAEAPMRVSASDPVEIHLKSVGWISGHVAWISDGRVGIAFDHPIDPKAARTPVGKAELDLPAHLRKLNDKPLPGKIRRV